MAIKNQQDYRTNRSQTDQQTVERNPATTTPLSQFMERLGKLTERLPTSAPSSLRRPTPRQYTNASPERIKALIDALGDTQHPDHIQAVDALNEIGPPAVPALCDALQTQQPWLTAYRAAEALGCISDGSATGALIQALRHPNSNVRWSAVRALTQIGDLRALFELNHIAQHDHGRTSWGESVAAAAHSALDQMRNRGVVSQGVELVKTAVTSVLMILALILAFSVISTLRANLDQFGDASNTTVQVVPTPQNAPPADENRSLAPPPLESPTLQPLPSPTPDPLENAITGTVLQGANVRPFPSTQNQPVGELSQGDEILFVGRTSDGDWYMIRLGERHADGSVIDNPNGSGTGWVNRALLSEPEGEVPVRDPEGADTDTTTTPEADFDRTTTPTTEP